MSRPGLLAVASAVAVWTLAVAAPAGAQAAREESRVALVIGNSTYREVPLRNPVNDVRAMAKTLSWSRSTPRSNPKR